jgi:DNA invertase Pin-like site-specific DNA recombinase
MAVIYGLVLKSDLTQVRYVGRTKGEPEKRFLTHKKDAEKGSDLPVHRWMRKHEDATYIILEDSLSVEDYVDRETYYIGKLKKDGHSLLNCTETGEDGAVTLTAETRTKISKSLTGNSKASAGAKRSWESRKAKTVKSVEDVASSRKTKSQEDQLALLYARVSTSMQVQDGVSLDVQERALRQAAELAGYTLTELVREEGRSGKSISGRPALKKTLNRLASGEADALFVTRLDRLSRSTQDFLSIIDHSQKYGWRLVLLDLNLDTSSYQSRFVVTIMSALAEMERSIISERQKDVHSDRRSQGKVWGVDLGPKKRIPEVVLNRIYTEREAGESMNGIARRLNAESIPAAYGGKWSASSIKYVLDQQSDEAK